MFYPDTITKSFLTTSTYPRKGETLRWTRNDDPTYMGFWVHFIQPQLAADYQDLDYLPQGLLMSEGKPGSVAFSDSAINFLKRRNEHYRAAMIQEFQSGLLTISNKEPWMFQKITGMGELWKIDPGNPWRTKDKKIVLECLESIDLKMSYLVDLYRKAAFDSFYMKYILPDCQRYFSMEVIVSEIRTIQQPGGLPLNTATFYNFLLDYCEFDFFSDEIGYMESLTSFSEGKAATVKLPIKVGRIREFNTYGLLGAYLQDTANAAQRSVEQRDKSFDQTTTQSNTNGSKIADGRSAFEPQRYENFSSAEEANRTNTNRNRDNGRQNSIGGGGEGNNGAGTGRPDYKAPVNPLLAGALGALDNALQTVTNSAKLGNVYGLSVSGLSNTLQGLLNNPVGAVQGLLTNNGINQAPPQAVLGNIGLNGQDSAILKSLIGKVDEVAGIIAGTRLETQTIGDLIKGVEASQNLQGNPASAFNAITNPSQGLQGSPLNANLSGTQTPIAVTGNANLTPPNVNLIIDPVRLVLDSSGASSTGSAGRTIFSGAPSALDGTTGKVILEAPSSNASTANTVPLTGPTVPPAETGNVMFESVPVVNNNPGNAGLNGAPLPNAEAGKVVLEQPVVNMQVDPKNAGLTGGSNPPSTLGNVKLQ